VTRPGVRPGHLEAHLRRIRGNDGIAVSHADERDAGRFELRDSSRPVGVDLLTRNSTRRECLYRET
jgi:hypothetical protein